MASKDMCLLVTEAEVMRACGDLYIAHGLESACGTLMFFFFGVITVKLHARGHLKSPATAFMRFVGRFLYEFFEEFGQTLMTIGLMPTVSLETRLRFCGNIDKMTNALSALLSLIGVTRWLSIGNVNGMRYIGYALTCPLMQMELVVLLAPVVPCFKLTTLTSFVATLMTLLSGYSASLMWMPLWRGDLKEFFMTWDPDALDSTPKLGVVSPAFCGIGFLSLCMLPFLLLIYKCHGGSKNPQLPEGYPLLVVMVWCTWLCFPVWWMLSWEGMTVITDTRFNELGFTLLNITAKGLFTFQGFRMGAMEEHRRATQGISPVKAPPKSALKGSKKKEKKDGEQWDVEGQTPGPKTGKGGVMPHFLPDQEEKRIPSAISRASSKKLSRSMFVGVLRDFDSQPKEHVLSCDIVGTGVQGHMFDRKGRAVPAGADADMKVPVDESMNISNPWFRSCLSNSYRPRVGHYQRK